MVVVVVVVVVVIEVAGASSSGAGADAGNESPSFVSSSLLLFIVVTSLVKSVGSDWKKRMDCHEGKWAATKQTLLVLWITIGADR